MPTLFLHTGQHKTGTTSLQKALADNRAHLERHGFLYPDTGRLAVCGSWGHHDLAYALRDRARGLDLWRALRKEADAAGLDNVIVSSEELSLLPYAGHQPLEAYRVIASCFEGWRIRLITYLRPQADKLASLYNHHVKAIGETRPIIEFLASVSPRLDYNNYLNVAAQGLGHDAIVVRRYTRIHLNGDIVTDLAEVVGLPLGPAFHRRERLLNPGLTTTGLEAMLDANRRLADDHTRLARERDRIIRNHAADPFSGANPLGEVERRVIEAIYRQRNKNIARHFLKLEVELFEA